jgi:DNA-binding XRE family transcriptional regulator
VKNRLKVLRAERDWSQAHLADELGVSRQTVNALETGRYDPSLPLAFKIARLFQMPIESIFIDERNTPLYPFGYGQSYTRFSFDELQVETPMVMAGGAARISVRITNAGAQMGQEVAQLYVRQPLASISRPVRQLKAFTKLALKPGENRRVTFMVEARDLGYHDAQGRLVIEPGLFDVYVGNSSLATLKGSFTLAAGARP